MVADVGFDGFALEVDVEGGEVNDHLHSGYGGGLSFRGKEPCDDYV